MILRALLALTSLAALLAPIAPAFAQDDAGEEATIHGQISGKTYIAPSGAYRVEIPVLPELGGAVTDTPHEATFQDDINTNIRISHFPLDAQLRWENETRGRKEFLIWFFANAIQAKFEQLYPGAKIESARFNAGLHDGALFTFNTLPGGSAFEERSSIGENETPVVAKRGNLLFVKNEHIYIVSIELAERVLERSTYKKASADEDEILRGRLSELLSKMSFAAAKKPAPAKPAAAPNKAPAAPAAPSKAK